MSSQHPIRIRLIDHVVVVARDLANMIDFYTRVLGCRVERGPGDLGLAQLRAGASLIDLVDAGGQLGRDAGQGGRNMDHFCVQVDPWDVDAILAHLRLHGVEGGEVVMRYGALGNGPSLYIDDPEGNTVELKGPPHLA